MLEPAQANPYNPVLPGNLFCGFDKELQRMLRQLRDGQSLAVIGGRRCGKTSLLMQLEQRIAAQGLAGYAARPLRHSLQAEGALSAAELLGRIFQWAAADCDRPWTPPPEGQAYRGFLAQLAAAYEAIVARHGADWLLVLLLDEFDVAAQRLPDDEFFGNLRHLLMESDFRQHFRLVASGASGMGSLIVDGSPLNCLMQHTLRLFKPKEARQLLAAGFGEDGEDFRHRLFELTGRHPYLMQGLLNALWYEQRDEIDASDLRLAAETFLRERGDSDLRVWLDKFDKADHALLQLLAERPNCADSPQQLRQRMPADCRGQFNEARRKLSFHGLLDNEDTAEIRLSGSLFRDWYLQHAEPLIQPAHAEAAPPGAELAAIPSLIAELRRLAEREQIRAEVQAVVMRELSLVERMAQQAGSGQPVAENQLKSSLDKASDAMRSAGDLAGTTTTFVDRAQALVQPMLPLLS